MAFSQRALGQLAQHPEETDSGHNREQPKGPPAEREDEKRSGDGGKNQGAKKNEHGASRGVLYKIEKPANPAARMSRKY